MRKLARSFAPGFTLIELLIVIAIIAVLVTIGIVSFRSSQLRGRDIQRKSDLKQIASSLELFYSDYGQYPVSDGGAIKGCPYPSTDCLWGSTGADGTFTDAKTVYFQQLPKDPAGRSYYYRTVSINDVANQGFQLFAALENPQDINCLLNNAGVKTCTSPVVPEGVTCGGADCNFAITSPNTTPRTP